MKNLEMSGTNCPDNDIELNNLLRRRRGRTFDYDLNEKRAKAKLLKGAKRAKHLNVEIKSGCVNMRFSDGAYFEVVLPLLREWHKREAESFVVNDLTIKVDEIDAGIDKTDKHMDTKLIITVNTDRIVLHAYNGTQNLMVQGKNYVNFAVSCLEPFFTEKINAKIENVDKFNDGVCKILVIQRSEAKQQVLASVGGRNRSAITLASVENFTI